MDDLPIPKRIAAGVIGPLYATCYHTANRRLLGVTVAGWVQWLAVLLAVVAFLRGWSLVWIAAGIALFAVTRLLYWKARRDGYVRFVAAESQRPPEKVEVPADDQRVKVRATGSFSVTDEEEYVLQRPAEYWRVPLGDHAVMVQRRPGRYLYQFIQAGTLQQLRQGYLLFGRRPQRALALTFLTTWGPQAPDKEIVLYSPSGNHSEKKLQRTIYLTFANEVEKWAVWNNLLRDAHQAISQKA